MQLRTTNPMDGFESSEDEEGVGAITINSPDKEYDFRGRKCDDDSVASGDDSITWEKETMKIMKTFAEATALEEAKAEETVQEDAPVSSLLKFYLFALVFSCILPFLVEFPKLRVGERGFFERLLAKITWGGRIFLLSLEEKQEILPFS
jgi:hypothetical protein